MRSWFFNISPKIGNREGIFWQLLSATASSLDSKSKLNRIETGPEFDDTKFVLWNESLHCAWLAENERSLSDPFPSGGLNEKSCVYWYKR